MLLPSEKVLFQDLEDWSNYSPSEFFNSEKKKKVNSLILSFFYYYLFYEKTIILKEAKHQNKVKYKAC